MLHKDELGELEKADKKFRAAHRAISAEIGRGYLRCLSCGRTETLTYRSVEEYLRSGWPMCCGATMALYADMKLAVNDARAAMKKAEPQ